MTEYFSLAYYIKIGVPIGKYEKRQGFTPNFEYPRYFTSHFLTHALTEIEMVAYTRGLPLSYPGEDQDIILTYADRTV